MKNKTLLKIDINKVLGVKLDSIIIDSNYNFDYDKKIFSEKKAKLYGMFNYTNEINFDLDEFKNEEVGLVLKVNTANDSIMDRSLTDNRLKNLLQKYSDKKCSITLVHGHLSEAQMESLYTHSKINAIVSTTHGEGFGLPLLEAAANELPVVATDWSGHTDFLYVDGKRMFGKIDYELKPIAKEHVWKGVLEENTSWAYPIMSSYKEKMREVYKDYGRFKSQAKKLAPWVKEKYSQDSLKSKFELAVLGDNNGSHVIL